MAKANSMHAKTEQTILTSKGQVQFMLSGQKKIKTSLESTTQVFPGGGKSNREIGKRKSQNKNFKQQCL